MDNLRGSLDSEKDLERKEVNLRMPDFNDQTLKCRDCDSDFVWTASEQDFYQQKGFDNPPSRCPKCRQAKKQQRMGDRQLHDITCAKCGKAAQVPFEPRGDRPVYCRDCFQEMRNQPMAAAPAPAATTAPAAPAADEPAEESTEEKKPAKK